MAFYRGQGEAFRAVQAIEMGTGLLAPWPERKEAKQRASWPGRVEWQAARREDWQRRQVERRS